MSSPRPLIYATFTVALVAIVFQAFVPPVVGLANQGDFRRVIGTFGLGPEEGDQQTGYAYVARKYVPDPNYRLREWEMPTSEYLFVGTAVFLNRIVSKDGKLDITVIGWIHALFFCIALWRLLVALELIGAPYWL